MGMFIVKVKMKRCTDCQTLLSNSTKVCSKCGSRQLEKGVYSDESNQSVLNNKHQSLIVGKQSNSGILRCPTCGAGVTTTLGFGECSVCGDELSSDGSSYYMDYIDKINDR